MAKRIFDKHPRDRFQDFLWTIFRTLNPEAYHELSQNTLYRGFRFLSSLIVFSVLIMALLIGFNLAGFHQAIQSELLKVDSISFNRSLTEPIYFDKQNIRIANQANYTGENLLVTDEAVIRKPTLCTLIKPACIIQQEPIVTPFEEIQENRRDIANFAFLMLMLMIPGLLLVYLVYFLVKTILLIVALSYAAKLIARAARYRIKFRRITMIAIYSSSVFILLEPFNLIMWNLYYVHLLLYIALFSLGVILVGEGKHKYHNA